MTHTDFRKTGGSQAQLRQVTQIVRDVIEGLTVPGQQRAVILERIAFGAGQTEWYLCEIDAIESDVVPFLRPGSLVSFYVDDRFVMAPYSDVAREVILDIAKKQFNAVVAWRNPDRPSGLIAHFPAGPGDLADIEPELRTCSEIVYGEFPGRDNDGQRAVTITIPDDDGVIRPHPY